jgi:hypothetical protein
MQRLPIFKSNNSQSFVRQLRDISPEPNPPVRLNLTLHMVLHYIQAPLNV